MARKPAKKKKKAAKKKVAKKAKKKKAAKKKPAKKKAKKKAAKKKPAKKKAKKAKKKKAAKKKPAKKAKKKAAKKKPAKKAKKKAAKKKPAKKVAAAPAEAEVAVAPTSVAPVPPPPPALPKPAAPAEPSEDEKRLLAAFGARTAFWSTLGQVDGEVLSHIINPNFMGGPRWPAFRQAWRVVRRDGSTCLVSDGLSDPFDEQPPSVGFGLEFVIEVDEPGLPEHLPGTWLWDAIYEVSQTAAGHGGVRGLLEELGTVSVEVSGIAFPEQMRSEGSGRVGVVLGVPAMGIPQTMQLPFGDVLVVPITVLQPAELKHVLAGGDAARSELVTKLIGAGIHHRCRINRPSVI